MPSWLLTPAERWLITLAASFANGTLAPLTRFRSSRSRCTSCPGWRRKRGSTPADDVRLGHPQQSMATGVGGVVGKRVVSGLAGWLPWLAKWHDIPQEAL